MNWKGTVAVGLGAILLISGLGAAYYSGFGPAPGGADAGDQITDFPTQTPAADGTEDDGSQATPTATGPAFAFTIDQIQECGLTCRDVTATLHNNQESAETEVTVYSRIYAGQNSTDSDALVWEGKQDVGTLEAGAPYTSTRQVEISLQAAQQIEQAGGWVTIVTTVQSDERTVTFRDSERVA